jgi:hypothetical protein
MRLHVRGGMNLTVSMQLRPVTLCQYSCSQVNSLLASLHISPADLPAQLPHAHDAGGCEVSGVCSDGK